MSIAQIVCNGFGPSASISGIVLRGFTPGAAPSIVSNPRRTVECQLGGFEASFPGMWVTEDDVLTFDVTALLDAGETIALVESFTLYSAQDLAPNLRVLAGPAVSGNLIYAKVGNWQAIRYANYLVTAVFTTSLPATLTAQAYLAVQGPSLGLH